MLYWVFYLRVRFSSPQVFTFVYDYKSSAITFGDFIYVSMLARFVLASGHQLKLIFIESGTKPFYYKVDPEYLKQKQDEIAEMGRVLWDLAPEMLERLSWEEFKRRYHDDRSLIFPPRSYIMGRKRYILRVFNLINFCIRRSSQDIVDKFLISEGSLQSLAKQASCHFPFKDYISWGVRANPHYHEYRNTTQSEFYEIHNLLSQSFPGLPIVVISDPGEVEIIRDWAGERNLEVYFSKDSTTSFLGDLLVAAQSQFYFQFKGGGVMLPFLARRPYLYLTKNGNEDRVDVYRLCYWAEPYQIFFPDFEKWDRGLADRLLKRIKAHWPLLPSTDGT